MRFFQKPKTPEDRTPEFYTKAGVGLYTDEDLIQLIEFVIKEENSVGIFIMNSVHITALVRVGQGKALYVDHDRLQILEADRYGAALIKERMGTSVLSMEQVSSIDLDLLTTTQPLEQLYSKVREQLKESELLLAFERLCKVGDLDGVRHLVQKKGVDPKDSRFNNTYTPPLIMSIICNHMELVKYLVEECSVDMNIQEKKYGHTATMAAIIAGNFEGLKYLVEKGADLTICSKSNQKTLDCALYHDALHVVSYLLELPEIKETITLQEAFKIALDYGAEKVVRYLEPLVDVTKEPLEQSFTRAILKKDLELVTSLVEEKEVEPSKVLEGQNSLVYASKYSTPDILEFLLKKIKDINLEDTDGASPLKRILSEKKINWKAVKLFLEHGADYETKNSDGEPLLVLSARDGALEILTQLKTRADIDLGPIVI
jgi:ankyrin repeat protein